MWRGIWPVMVIPNIGGIFQYLSVIAGSVPSITTDFIGDFCVVHWNDLLGVIVFALTIF